MPERLRQMALTVGIAMVSGLVLPQSDPLACDPCGGQVTGDDAARLFVEARRRRMLTFLIVGVAICIVWLVFCWLLGGF